MEEGETKEDIYGSAKWRHVSFERRLQMLLKKPYLTEEEEFEIKILKKKKLYFKDIMEKTKVDPKEGDET
jgi:hypothetical protein